MVVVFYDLETSGLNLNHCEVLQIGARCGGHNFTRYVMPEYAINSGATAVNGLYISDGGLLCKNGQVLNASDPRDAWLAFIDYLDRCGGNVRVVLAAHNGNRFDHHVLMRSVGELGLRSNLLRVADECADTKLHFPLYQSRRRLGEVAADFGIDNSKAHDALGDVTMMRRLCREFDIDDVDLENNSQSLENFD